MTFDDWLGRLRKLFVGMEQEYLDLFDIYAAEARFGRIYIAGDIDQLHQGAKILEVGAGSLILSCYLIIEGFDVTAIEPVESGFTHFKKMQQIVLDQAKMLGCLPVIVEGSAENFNKTNEYDYAFSINVMEHVRDVSKVLENIATSLVAGACYRFTCPNYHFPYEPHFNIPTLFTKQMTENLFRKKIYENRQMSDPAGVWNSLNWITVSEISRYAHHLQQFEVSFGRDIILSAIERIALDVNFSHRRSLVVRSILMVLLRTRIYRLLQFMPAIMQPIIDCRVRRVI